MKSTKFNKNQLINIPRGFIAQISALKHERASQTAIYPISFEG